MKASRYIENVKIVVEEAASPEQSLAARMAKRELATLHRDLPEVLTNVANITSLVAEQNLERLALSYSDAAVREISATGKDRLTTLDKIHAINNASKAVIVQEAAAHILHLRDPGQSTDSFHKLKKAYDVPAANPGEIAIGAMKKMGVDMQAFCRDMNKNDLRAMAMGQFHRVEDQHRDRVINLLQVSGNELYTLAHGPKIDGNDYGPVVNASQPQNRERSIPAAERKPSFGQRMAEAHRMQMTGTGR